MFLGDDIQINADASNGSLRVAILDANGKPVDGFSAADCQALRGDQLRHKLHWKGQQNIAELKGRPIRLQFYLDQAKLFSFTPTTHRDQR